MYISSWGEYECPKCKTHNLVSHGDMNDPTDYDPRNCKCFLCDHVFSVADEYTRLYEDQDFSDFVVGFQMPRRYIKPNYPEKFPRPDVNWD